MIPRSRLNHALILALTLSASSLAAAQAGREKSEAIPVAGAAPVVRDIDYILSALGSVESLSSPTISAETAGRVTHVALDVGSSAESGELLATIDNALHQIQVAEAEAEYRRQQVMLDNQRREVDRLRRLASSQSVSQDRLEDQQDQLAMLEAQQDVARKRLEHVRYLEAKTRVVAPQAGTVARRHVSSGDYVLVGQPLFDLVTVDRLRARLAFPEQDASSIELGQLVYLNTPAAPDRVAQGEVTQINPRINAANRAIEVLVEFDNPGGWYPGGSVNATLVFDRNLSALTIPRHSIVRRGGQDVVFVITDERASARSVQIGWQDTEWVEVIAGIHPGEHIVVEGAAQLSDGSALHVSNVAP